MTARLSINLCTRNRAHLLGETIERTLANISLPTTTLVVSLDDDDHSGRAIAMQYFSHIGVSVLPREDSLGEKYNRILRIAPADVYMVMVDYAPVITPKFDEIVLEAASIYPDGYAVVHGPYANMTFPCIQAVTDKMADKMGGIYPSYFPYWFIDHWLDDIAHMVDRKVFAGAVTEFWERRPGTMERREPGFWATFFDSTYEMRCDIARKIIRADDFDDTPARKRAMEHNWPLTFQHSQLVNNICRDNDKEIGDPTRDARYERIKARAIQLLDNLQKAPAADADALAA